MKLALVKASTSVSVLIFIQDSSSTTGAGLTGLVFNSSGLTAYYCRPGSASVAITLATLAAANSAWSSGGFKEVDSANMPGVYRLDIPDAALASGANSSVVFLKGAANMAPLPLEIQLTSLDLNDGVRAALTALPNAAAEAAGGLFTRGAGAGQINQDANGRIDANVKTWISGAIPAVNVTGVPLVDAKYLLGTIFATPATAGIPDVNVKNVGNTLQTARDLGASVLLSSGTGTGQLDFTAGVVKANLAQILATALTETAGQLAGGFKKFFNIAAPAATMDHGILVDTVTTYTGNTPQTGDSFARIGVAGVGLTNLGDSRIANLDATISSRAAASVLGTPAGASVSADIAALPTAASNADKILGRSLAGGADGGRTMRDALRLNRNKWAITGGVLTVYAEDDTTPAWTAPVTTAASNPINSVDPT